MPVDRSVDRRAAEIAVHVSVLEARLEEELPRRSGTCLLVVESTRPLPRAPYRGSVRVGGTEETATGLHPIRLLKHFEIAIREIARLQATYFLVIDLSDEWQGTSARSFGFAPPPRRVTEPTETICKRVAGIFARHCEEFRPPSVVVTYEP
jgi:hypothetical protein